MTKPTKWCSEDHQCAPRAAGLSIDKSSTIYLFEAFSGKYTAHVRTSGLRGDQRLVLMWLIIGHPVTRSELCCELGASVCECVLSLSHSSLSLQTASLIVGNKSLPLNSPCLAGKRGDVMRGVFFFYERSPVISGGDQLAEQSACPAFCVTNCS